MLAARMYGKNDIRLEEVPTPSPKKGEVVIKVEAAAVCGTDVRMITNGVKGIDENNPRILGHEFAGTIHALGEGVSNHKIGQRVAFAPNFGCGHCPQCLKGNGHLCPEYQATGINIDGGFAEYVLIPASAVKDGNICEISDKVSFEEGAVIEPLSCVYNGFEHADIHKNDIVLVVGAGPIGMMHCTLALMAGAKVYLNDISESRLVNAKKIYPQLNTIQGDPKEEIFKVSEGQGADVIICACPVPAVQIQALELGAVGARIVFFGGIPADKEPVALNTNLIHYRQLIVTGTTRASLSQYRKTLKLVEDGLIDLKPLITKSYNIKDIKDAIEQARLGIGYKNTITF